MSWGWFKDKIKLFGERISNLSIQKSSLCSKRLRPCCLGRDVLFIFLMIVNLAFSLNLCPAFLKCLSHGRPSALHTSFLWVLILKCSYFIQICQYIGSLYKGNIPSNKLVSCFCV